MVCWSSFDRFASFWNRSTSGPASCTRSVSPFSYGTVAVAAALGSTRLTWIRPSFTLPRSQYFSFGTRISFEFWTHSDTVYGPLDT